MSIETTSNARAKIQTNVPDSVYIRVDLGRGNNGETVVSTTFDSNGTSEKEVIKNLIRTVDAFDAALCNLLDELEAS